MSTDRETLRQQFLKMCLQETPTSWDLEAFGSQIAGQWRLIGFEGAQVEHVTCYQSTKVRSSSPRNSFALFDLGIVQSVTHDFVLIKVKPVDQALGDTIWMRAERRPSSRANPLEMSKGVMPASDTVQISYSTKTFLKEGDRPIKGTEFNALKVSHIADLLGIIHQEAESYSLFKSLFSMLPPEPFDQH